MTQIISTYIISCTFRFNNKITLITRHFVLVPRNMAQSNSKSLPFILFEISKYWFVCVIAILWNSLCCVCSLCCRLFSASFWNLNKFTIVLVSCISLMTNACYCDKRENKNSHSMWRREIVNKISRLKLNCANYRSFSTD